MVPVARYSACEIAWHRWKQAVVAAYGLAPVAANMVVFPAITYRERRGVITVRVRNSR